MGRIKTRLIKRVTRKILDLYRDRFTDNYDENKKVIDSVSTMPNKKIRNTIAGYVTRLVKKKDM